MYMYLCGVYERVEMGVGVGVGGGGGGVGVVGHLVVYLGRRA